MKTTLPTDSPTEIADQSILWEVRQQSPTPSDDDAPVAKSDHLSLGGILRQAWNPTRRSWTLRLAFIVGSVVVAGLVLVGLTHDLRQMGYLGVFLASFTSGASMFLPLPGLAVVIAASLVLQPWAVGLLAGVGGAFGEMTGYAVGCSSHRIVKSQKIPTWLYHTTQKHMVLTIIAISIIPNPFVDFVGIIAGRLCYPVSSFLAYTMIGKTVRAMLLAYAVAWGFPLVEPVIGVST